MNPVTMLLLISSAIYIQSVVTVSVLTLQCKCTTKGECVNRDNH